MGVRSKLMTETWLLKYIIETKHPADLLTVALKASAACRIASSVFWRQQTAWTNDDNLHSQHYFLAAPQSLWSGLQISLFSIFHVICAARPENFVFFLRHHYFGFFYLPTCFITAPSHVGLSNHRLYSLAESSCYFNPENGGKIFFRNVVTSTKKPHGVKPIKHLS